jgi:predicted nucleic acid-binding protein
VTSYVLDASVAAAWFLPLAQEPFSESAIGLLEQYAAGRLRLLVPDLFWPEIGNIFRKAARQKRVTREAASEALNELADSKLPTFPSAGLLRDAFTIASEFGCTVYDATYVALAVVSSAPLVTADERMVNSLGSRLPVRWLGAE